MALGIIEYWKQVKPLSHGPREQLNIGYICDIWP